MKLVITGSLPTLNEMIDAAKRSKYAYAEMKTVNDELVAWTAKSQRIASVERAEFEILWICKDRKFDPDNITGGEKFIFDGLRLARVLKNDGWKQVARISHDFAVDRENPRIEIIIRECG